MKERKGGGVAPEIGEKTKEEGKKEGRKHEQTKNGVHHSQRILSIYHHCHRRREHRV